jgi:hypothetical protein
MPRERFSYPAPDSDRNRRRFYENPVQRVKPKSLNVEQLLINAQRHHRVNFPCSGFLVNVAAVGMVFRCVIDIIKRSPRFLSLRSRTMTVIEITTTP